MSEASWPKVTSEDPCHKCGTHKRGCTRTSDRGRGHCHKTGETWHDDTKTENNARPYRAAAKPTRKSTARAYATREAAIESVLISVRKDSLDALLTRVFEYDRLGGGSHFCIARFDWPGDKSFRPVHPSGSEWRIGDPDDRLTVYRVNQFISGRPLYVCEGEKAAEATIMLDLAATTSAHGSKSADKTDWTPVANHDGEIIILPDNDDAGEKYARDVLRLIFKINAAAKVKVVRLPDLPPKGDIVEFIDAGGTKQEVEQLTDEASYVDASEILGGPVLVSMADVAPVAIEWLWKGKIPLGRLTLMVGRPGEGKSFCTCDFAARVSRGWDFPDQSPCPKGSVIFICGEDDPGDTIRPRLDAADADVTKIHLLAMVKRPTDEGMAETLFTLADVAALEMALKRVPDCKLIVIDPIGSFLGGKVDAHRDNEVRGVLAPVAALAAKYGAAVLIVAHIRKASSSAADDTVLGSRAFTGIARSVWHLSRDKADRDRRLLLPGKNNLAAQPDGMAFTIGGDPARLTWESTPVKMHADDVMEEASQPGPEPEARHAAEEWLRSVLAAGPVPSGDLNNPTSDSIRGMAKEADFKWKTVRNACDHLGIRKERDPYTKTWVWRLPKTGTNQVAPLGQHEKLGQLGQVEGQHGKTKAKPAPPIQLAQEDSVLACAREGNLSDFFAEPAERGDL